MIILLSALLPVLCRAASTRAILEKAKGNYEAGHLARALDLVDQAVEKNPEEPFAFYDKGNVLYRQGKYKEAISSYEQAALQSNTPELTAKSYYNMGNAALNRAQGEMDGEKSLALLNNSAESYRNALNIDPSLQNAAHNLELVRQAIKQKKEELRQQQQKQGNGRCDRPRNKDETQKNLEDMINRQKKQAEKNKANSQGRNSGEQNQQMADEQENLRHETEQTRQQLGRRQSGKNDKAEQELRKAMADQQQAEDELKNNQPAQAAEKQEEAAGHLQQALESLQDKDNKKNEQEQQKQDKKEESSRQQEQQNKKGEEQQAGQPEKGNPPPAPEESSAQAEAEPSPRDILELERKLRQLRQQQMNRTYQGVEKDW